MKESSGINFLKESICQNLFLQVKRKTWQSIRWHCGSADINKKAVIATAKAGSDIKFFSQGSVEEEFFL